MIYVPEMTNGLMSLQKVSFFLHSSFHTTSSVASEVFTSNYMFLKKLLRNGTANSGLYTFSTIRIRTCVQCFTTEITYRMPIFALHNRRKYYFFAGETFHFSYGRWGTSYHGLGTEIKGIFDKSNFNFTL